MTKHTPGPWAACKSGECRCGMIWDATGNCLVKATGTGGAQTSGKGT